MFNKKEICSICGEPLVKKAGKIILTDNSEEVIELKACEKCIQAINELYENKGKKNDISI